MSPDPLSATLFALADPTRRALLARLAQGDATVNELAAPFDMTVAAVSKHLKVLEQASLIRRGKVAQWRPCRLEPAPLKAASEYLEGFREFWERNADSFDAYLRTLVETPPPKS